MSRAITGFLAAKTAVSAVPTSYTAGKVITLDWDGTEGTTTILDDQRRQPPMQVLLDHLEMRFSGAGSVTAIEFLLTWDAAGDQLAFGPLTSAVTPAAGVTTAAVKGASFSFGDQLLDWNNKDAIAAKTSSGNAQQLFLHVKLTGATATLQMARLWWKQALRSEV
tara:strand:- start:1907 stop:2401 length:495 start_codon:yes stop_codon:yes gene_type:complete